MVQFETELLTTDKNLIALSDFSGHWIDRVHERSGLKRLVLDMDSSDSPTFGQQEGSIFNGHFRCTCYHPLFVFNQFGDVERGRLRPGNVHSSKGWRETLEPVVARYRDQKLTRSLRADAHVVKKLVAFPRRLGERRSPIDQLQDRHDQGGAAKDEQSRGFKFLLTIRGVRSHAASRW